MKIKILMILFVLLSLGMSGCMVDEEEMPYIPTEDEIELTASLEEDADYYFFSTRIEYLNEKVESGHVNFFIEFDKETSNSVQDIEYYAREHTAYNVFSYFNQETNPEPDHPEYYIFLKPQNNSTVIPEKSLENISNFIELNLDYYPEKKKYFYAQTKYWIPKNQDFRLDTLAVVIEHWDYTGSNSTKSVYKEIPFVHTMEGTAE